MKEIKTIVVGAGGKMGGRIIQMIKETPSMKLLRAIERPDHPSIGKDIGEVVGLGKLDISLKKYLLHFSPFYFEMNRQDLTSARLDRYRRFHQPLQGSNQSRGHGPCATGQGFIFNSPLISADG